MIRAYIRCHVDGTDDETKQTLEMERFKILREGAGFAYNPSNHNQDVTFEDSKHFLIELVFDGNFLQFIGVEIQSIKVFYPDDSTALYVNCKILDVRQKGRFSYILIEAD